MLNAANIARLLTLQDKSYALLLWLVRLVDDGPMKADQLRTLGTHFRPLETDVDDVAGLLSTYFLGSFVLLDQGRMRPPYADFCCAWCTPFVEGSRLVTPKTRSADKQEAKRLRRAAVQRVADEAGLAVPRDVVHQAAGDVCASSLVAYAQALERRARGEAVGSAALVLWRGFAWSNGGKRDGFRLTADMVVDAEAEVMRRLACANVEAAV